MQIANDTYTIIICAGAVVVINVGLAQDHHDEMHLFFIIQLFVISVSMEHV